MQETTRARGTGKTGLTLRLILAAALAFINKNSNKNPESCQTHT